MSFCYPPACGNLGRVFRSFAAFGSGGRKICCRRPRHGLPTISTSTGDSSARPTPTMRSWASRPPISTISKWQAISTPHTFNDIDSFRTMISHGGGDRGSLKGSGILSQAFQTAASAKDGKVLLEFEGIAQAGEIFLNGKSIGLSENGVTAYGVDITMDAYFGDQENVLAVCVDNRTTYAEKVTGTRFEWNTNDFNPSLRRFESPCVAACDRTDLSDAAGLRRFETTGVYVYPTEISIADRTANIGVDSQVHNASGDLATVTLTAAVVDRDGKLCAKFDRSRSTW